MIAKQKLPRLHLYITYDIIPRFNGSKTRNCNREKGHLRKARVLI